MTPQKCPYCQTEPILYHSAISGKWSLLCMCRGNEYSTNHMEHRIKAGVILEWNKLKDTEGIKKLVRESRENRTK